MACKVLTCVWLPIVWTPHTCAKRSFLVKSPYLSFLLPGSIIDWPNTVGVLADLRLTHEVSSKVEKDNRVPVVTDSASTWLHWLLRRPTTNSTNSRRLLARLLAYQAARGPPVRYALQRACWRRSSWYSMWSFAALTLETRGGVTHSERKSQQHNKHAAFAHTDIQVLGKLINTDPSPSISSAACSL